MMTPPWWRWPSWVTELVSGVALQGFLVLWGSHGFVLPLFVGLGISAGYEWGFDRNGWSGRDVTERAVGQGLVMLVWILLH